MWYLWVFPVCSWLNRWLWSPQIQRADCLWGTPTKSRHRAGCWGFRDGQHPKGSLFLEFFLKRRPLTKDPEFNNEVLWRKNPGVLRVCTKGTSSLAVQKGFLEELTSEHSSEAWLTKVKGRGTCFGQKELQVEISQDTKKPVMGKWTLGWEPLLGLVTKELLRVCCGGVRAQLGHGVGLARAGCWGWEMTLFLWEINLYWIRLCAGHRRVTSIASVVPRFCEVLTVH